MKKVSRCDCGRNVTGSGFYQDHGSCEHCYYVGPDPERSEGEENVAVSEESLPREQLRELAHKVAKAME